MIIKVSILFGLLSAAVEKASAQGKFDPILPPLDNCNATDYYAGLLAAKPNVTTWNRDDIAALITQTHRRVLPSVGEKDGDDDVFKALVNLYPGELRETVRLVYRDVDFDAIPAGSPNTWKREDLWPIDRGLIRRSPSLTDVHSKIPVDATVQITKDDLFFGECGTVQPQESCRSPATVESAEDTSYDGKIWTPPAKSRGDIARALFYTQVRYSESLGLILTDCPPFRAKEFGYLSTLLKWHKDDPVSPEELLRNDKTCGSWQGNRNPFVDYPQLAAQIFGDPDTIQPGTNTYVNCLGSATNSPTATPNACSSIRSGDLPIFLMNSDDPDQIVFFPLADIDPDIEYLYVTDNAWNGNDFINTEGVMRFTIPDEGIIAGQAFGLGDGSPMSENWEEVSAPFSLSTDGDQILVYCLDADDVPNFLWGYSYNGPWSDPFLPDDQYEEGMSALPKSLELIGSVALTHFDNCVYNNTLDDRKTTLQQLFMDPDQYLCLNDQRIVLKLPDEISSSRPVFSVGVAAALAVVGTLALGML